MPLRWHDGIARIAREHAEQMASGAMPFSPLDENSARHVLVAVRSSCPGHDGVEGRFRAYPVVHRAAAENLVTALPCCPSTRVSFTKLSCEALNSGVADVAKVAVEAQQEWPCKYIKENLLENKAKRPE